MKNILEIRDDTICLTKSLNLSSEETNRISSDFYFVPSQVKTECIYDFETHRLIKESKEGGIIVLIGLLDDIEVTVQNEILCDKAKNIRFKLRCKEEISLKKDTPIIKIVENIDRNFNVSELDYSELNDNLEIVEHDFMKDFVAKSDLVLESNKLYKIRTHLKFKSNGKYIFLKRLHWKEGFVYQNNIYINDKNEEVIFSLKNLENEKILIKKDTVLYSLIRIKE